jgi:hypothetical protein
MSSLYHNKALGSRLASCGPVDQIVRCGPDTLEAIVSLTVQSDGAGLVHIVLSLDYFTTGGQTVLALPLAIYPLQHQGDALEDARLVAKLWTLPLRRATPGVGWEHDDDPGPVVLTPDVDLRIGG